MYYAHKYRDFDSSCLLKKVFIYYYFFRYGNLRHNWFTTYMFITYNLS